MEASSEEWKDVVGYEGLYMVSNKGRIKSLRNKNGVEIMRQRTDRAYCSVSLKVNQKSKIFFVHRLVAMAFVPNPFNYPEVNHKDEDKKNNNADNLEWCTRSYNINYGTRPARYSQKMKGRKLTEEQIEQMRQRTTAFFKNQENKEKFRTIMQSPEHRHKQSLSHMGRKLPESAIKKLSAINSKAVMCVETGVIYQSIKEASLVSGINNSGIAKCCKGVFNKAGGYTWKYI